MKQLVNAAVNKLTNLYQAAVNRKLPKELLALSDRQLEDIGLCRHKLLQGTAGYPWTMVSYVAPTLDVTDIVAPKAAPAPQILAEAKIEKVAEENFEAIAA